MRWSFRKNKKVQKLTRSLARVKKEVQKEEKALTSNVLTESETKVLPDSIQEHLDTTGDYVAFMPNEGPQTDFLAASEKDVLYGGAAGGGKSFAMLIDPLRYCHIKEHRALILRRSMPELRELIDKSRELYPKAFKGAKIKSKLIKLLILIYYKAFSVFEFRILYLSIENLLNPSRYSQI